MFSQLRNAVEQLAQPIRVPDASSHENNSEPTTSRSQSLDIQTNRSTSPLTSSQLAESAISSLRKSFVSQRNHNGSSSSTSPKPAQAPEPPKVHKSNLEERLRRATFAIGDASGSSTPQRSSRVASPSPMGRDRKPQPGQSPASSSLPDSLTVTSAIESDNKLEESLESSPQGQSIPEPQRALEVSEKKIEPVSVTEPSTSHSTDGLTSDELSTDSLSVDSESKQAAKSPKESLIPEQDGLTNSTVNGTFAAESPSPSTPSAQNFNETTQGSLLNEGTSIKENDQSTLEDSNIELDPESTPVVEDSSEVHANPLDATDAFAETTEDHDKTTTTAFVETKVEPISHHEPVNQPDKTVSIQPEPAEISTEKPITSSPIITPYHSLDDIPNIEPSSSETQSHSPEIKTEDEGSPEEQVEESQSEVPDKTSNSEPLPSIETLTQPPAVDQSAEVESLQARLALIEQRFSDVSASFKRLQAEKLAADTILKESSPLETISDADALREYFDNLKVKDQVFQDELKRLNQKLELQDDRFEEVREMHKMETHSLTDEIKKVRRQLDETEALFQAAQRATSHAEEAVEKQKEAFSQLQKEVDGAKNTAKEEEEKRVKAISLLKTVRQKLVKAEKDKEDALKEVAAQKEREKTEKTKEQIDRLNFQQELEKLTASHENAMSNLKAQFAKDMASARERHEQEINAIRGQSELELATLKASQAKDIGAKNSQIATLENSLNNVTRDKNSFFDQLQLRQAEIESAQAHLESLQHQNTEFQFQLRESNDRISLLKEEYSELLREQDSRSRDPVTSADEIARMVSATEVKYEAKLSELKRNISILEKERAEGEADWSKKLKEKVKELEDVKRILSSATRNREADENMVAQLKGELAHAQQTVQALGRQVAELPLLLEQIQEIQKTSKEREEEINVKILILEKQIEESKNRETQLKQANKTLREELRKVQSSAALLERQRNPGVGYWTTRVAEGNGTSDGRRSSVSTPPPEPSPRVSSPAPSTATSNKNEEEVNLEYLRNVILQFLEHKEMRPNLVKVLSIILHFTPQETRRLIAKV